MAGDLKEIQLLLLSAGGSRYGIDTEQIACLKNLDGSEPAVPFEQLMGASDLAGTGYSKMLIVKHNIRVPILINEPDEVATVSVGDIHRLPDILQVPAGSKGVWGLLLPQDHHEVILLVDFYKNQLFKRLTDSSDNTI